MTKTILALNVMVAFKKIYQQYTNLNACNYASCVIPHLY